MTLSFRKLLIVRSLLASVGVLHCGRFRKEPSSDEADDKFDNLEEEHDVQSKPETQNSADLRQQLRHGHHRLVFNHHWKRALQHDV